MTTQGDSSVGDGGVGVPVLSMNVDQPDEESIQQAAACLLHSGMLIHATDTVYGIAARWDDSRLLRRVNALKQRPPQQPFSLMVSDIEQIIDLAGCDATLAGVLSLLLPGPVTVLLHHHGKAPLTHWNRLPELGFRVPDHRLCGLLAKRSGIPLITTSANISGQPAPGNLGDIAADVLRGADLVLDSGPCIHGTPSTILRISPDHAYEVVREGAVSAADVEKIFRNIG